ncbi:617_t:CDS:2 [Funneliformis geosporum]|uniref:617_t:CDS:1 n=1 Tax=Funneliformis geosporum TaxID=1117311 RepID=A0A9W4SP12_9GLOM|nr:617_t:CDS:2 [Funneliformis geosporum]
MAYQLELIRLINFDITPCFTDNRQIHAYYAVGKENTSDYRFFIRSLVRPARLRNSTAIICKFHYNICVRTKQVEEAVKGFIDRHGKRLWRLRLTGSEVRFKVEDPTLGTSYPLRVIINNVSRYVVKVETYQETHLMGTELFRQAIRILWNRASHHSSNLKYSSDVLEANEIVLDENNNLREVERASERIHLVWLQISLLFLPEYPKGKKIIVIANDITYHTHWFFWSFRRSIFGIPRAYLSRIGLAGEVMNHFNVALIDKGNPSKYIEYLYLDLETYKQLHQNGRKSVIAERKETRHKITNIIGSKDGLGVECLKGSGLIAWIASHNNVLELRNLQLGGTQIMFKNVVSYLTAQNDLEGITKIMQWLYYVQQLALRSKIVNCGQITLNDSCIFRWSKGHDSKICILYRGCTYQLQAICICLYCSNGELRGGDWVVIDPTINDDMMEMYADEKSRAGVLEPEGIVEIKFRKPQLLATIENLDAREQELLPIYSRMAIQFADLHDTPGRMKSKEMIRKLLEWKESRRFFYVFGEGYMKSTYLEI